MDRSSPTIFSFIAPFVFIGWVAAGTALTPREPDILPQNILTVDVCVIGGGAAGTYAAIKSKDLNKTVAVVEQQDQLGEYTNTYVDPISKKSIELGVAEWEDTPIVRNFLTRFKVPLYQYNYTIPGITTKYVDFQSGRIAIPKQDDLLGAWDAFQM